MQHISIDGACLAVAKKAKSLNNLQMANSDFKAIVVISEAKMEVWHCCLAHLRANNVCVDCEQHWTGLEREGR